MRRLIDANELIEEIQSHRMVITGLRFGKGALKDFVKRYDESILKIIDDQPTVNDWIPCSERMPKMHREDMEEEGEYYMISDPVLVTDGNKMYVAEYETDDGYRYGWHSYEGEDYEGIIAWQQLPEPYRPDK